MTTKKLTRVFFYLLGTVAATTLLYYFIDYSIRYWDRVWNVYLVAGILLGALALFNLARWAFSPDPAPRFTKIPYLWVAPDYTVEGAYHLSDGRRCIPQYNGGKFTHNFPEDPYIGETVGDYTWGKHSSGTWVWLHKDGSK